MYIHFIFNPPRYFWHFAAIVVRRHMRNLSCGQWVQRGCYWKHSTNVSDTVAVRASVTTSREAACPLPGGWVCWWPRSTTLTRTCPQTPAPACPAVQCKGENPPPLLSTTSSSPVEPGSPPTRQLPSLTATESTTWAAFRSVQSFLITNNPIFANSGVAIFHSLTPCDRAVFRVCGPVISYSHWERPHHCLCQLRICLHTYSNQLVYTWKQRAFFLNFRIFSVYKADTCGWTVKLYKQWWAVFIAVSFSWLSYTRQYTKKHDQGQNNLFWAGSNRRAK